MKESKDILDINNVLAYFAIFLTLMDALYNYNYYFNKKYIIIEVIGCLILFVTFYKFLKSNKIKDEPKEKLKNYFVAVIVLFSVCMIFFKSYLISYNILDYLSIVIVAVCILIWVFHINYNRNLDNKE